MNRGFFIAGTDTGVGKTRVTTRLLAELRGRGLPAAGMKPIECGGRDDSLAIQQASGTHPPLEWVNPVSLAEPLAPAAVEPAVEIDFARITAAFNELARSHHPILVEGAGGWLVPIDGSRTMEDLATAVALPVIVVARNRLGVLNHTLLTLRAIAATGLACRAVYLNTIPDDIGDHSRSSNARVLRECLGGIPVIEDDLPALATLLC